ncbi:unnamed protein product [Tilletia laevis]|uniref:Uncharacterized protein n=2 Tax=Tilletia TaxID=13289 RepID=A0A177V9Y8_9BASI|nr:hypothetical protein CF336_g1949 [Tilletia laevis]KAE8263685.1 hypothetical protein A4X03_0g1502 [Tilletia caries]KAE8207292.1 hypothetical protein CF335_g1243 [Tilletia laevis]CAD6893319.1 unnamed protein product [Tilletia caries]CAD6920835.1 unnamed protein product [Tilletia laevis]
MPLGFGKKKKKDRSQASDPDYGHHGPAGHDGGHGHPHGGSSSQDRAHAQGGHRHVLHDQPARLPKGSVDPVPGGAHKYAPSLSVKGFDVGGLPVNVFGLDELSPVLSRSTATRPPEVVCIFHLHGRGGSAKNEEHIVRQLYHSLSNHRNLHQGRAAKSSSGRARQAKNGRRGDAEVSHSMAEQPQGEREFVIVSFDARNHGHRFTSELGQKSWKDQNPEHAKDLYAMVHGTARDVSFLIDFLPAYIFPHDERTVASWTCTGKSLGGHSVWAILASEPRIRVGVPFIGCADFQKLLQDRARINFVTYGPPAVPHTLQALIKSIDPAANPHYGSFDARLNPFWGKKICVCLGQMDKLVKASYSEEFLGNLVVGEPDQDPRTAGTGFSGLKIFVQENTGHTVTELMVDVAGEWIYRWAIQC